VTSASDWAPDRGDLVWLSFEPIAGHEQGGRRPALVVSPRQYNARVGLAVALPVTGRQKGYPFEVALPVGLPVSGVVLADQVRSVDWRARRAEFICAAPPGATAEALHKLGTLVSP